ncbi:SGNH/GDSL hydrolase family protein [Paenibacillus ginsengarvi]|uniref:SGNH/GDSL hydrolase family protein n=1 Tax=Paenibacillus ginsengarvi TaxID=400777 RepID=A0A3B0AUF9_9BACL|nr:SGNH/GDSL hydrolase family protein [Paenibacillus ginsengarvi]RKN62876.1 SGNH/GDSL hydrolase family protein [Paenibacillus ginsengarvi]
MNESSRAFRPYDLLLPPVIPAVVGREVNVYFDNLIAGEASRYDFELITSIGRHRNDRWSCVPDKSGDYPLTVEVYSEEGVRLASASTLVRVKEAESPPGPNRRVLFIGDSTTAAGGYTEELLRLFALDRAGLSLLGTRGTGLNRHEGRGGWKVADYCGHAESPFLFDGKFDFARYMETNAYAGVDDVCIHLGINDVFHASEEDGMSGLLGQAMPMLEEMIRDVQRYQPEARIGLMMAIPPSRMQDSFGKSYGTLQSRRRYKRKWFLWNRELLRLFASREQSGIELIALHTGIDTAHNMPMELLAANARSGQTELRQSNGVHPAPEGYHQMADVMYAWLKP